MDSHYLWIVRQFKGKAVCSHLKVLGCIAALIGLAVLLGGCAAATALPLGSMLGSPNASALNIYHTTETRLDQRNFVVVKTNVVGQTSGFSLLGIITIVPAKFTKAMSRMYANAGVTPGQSQTIVNMNINQDSTYLILFSIPRTYVSGDVVEFISTNASGNEALPPSANSKPPSAP
jgi:hypothetical protein